MSGKQGIPPRPLLVSQQPTVDSNPISRVEIGWVLDLEGHLSSLATGSPGTPRSSPLTRGESSLDRQEPHHLETSSFLYCVF
ncbi:MAG: hypothetical protein ACKOJF_15340 [Planctomycetaceae bacterium]